MAGVEIRPATTADEEGVRALATVLATTARPTVAGFAASFAQIVAADSSLLLVAVDDDGVCGYLLAHLHPTFHADGPVVWGEEIVVEAGRRGKGVGRALMRAMELWAVEVDARYIALATRRDGGFYLALGYDESAVFYKKPVR